jgi:hypothetical protein
MLSHATSNTHAAQPPENTQILQNALSLMVGIYSRFLAILKAPPFKRSSGWPDLIDLHQLRVEVKKYKSMLG